MLTKDEYLLKNFSKIKHVHKRIKSKISLSDYI
jgi:hypothetical protein